MKHRDQIKIILDSIFQPKHVNSLLTHFFEAIKKYSQNDWEGVALKAGKFVEAVTKTLLVYCNQTLPRTRLFKASTSLRSLEKLDPSKYHDTIRIAIPKACLFVYEIACNRGGRHDPDEIDPNELDARTLIPLLSWILAELIRFANVGKDPHEAMAHIDSVIQRIYPLFEDIDGRPYVNLKRLSAKEIGLLLLYYKYPLRVLRKDLIDYVCRHGPRKQTAEVAVHRLKYCVDDDNGSLKLRGLGRQDAESVLRKIALQ